MNVDETFIYLKENIKIVGELIHYCEVCKTNFLKKIHK
jgi:hypothetical protein